MSELGKYKNLIPKPRIPVQFRAGAPDHPLRHGNTGMGTFYATNAS
jgi:hypothetical protein